MLHPEAFHLGPLTIRWYGIMVALGFLAGYLLVTSRAAKRSVPTDVAADLVFWCMLGGIGGARLLYVLQNWNAEFSGRWLEALRIDHGGLVFYGGLIGASVVLALVCARKAVSLAVAADLIAPALALGHAIGRLGCFLNGCCFGRPWDHAGAVQYAPPPATGVLYVQQGQGKLAELATVPLPVFPIQLVSTAVNIAIFLVLLLVLERRVRRPGQLFTLYVMLYAVSRFVVEFGRGDYLDLVGLITPAQLICMILFPLGAAGYIWLGRRPPQAPPGPRAEAPEPEPETDPGR